MKVAFFTEGSSRIGFGHITRCLSLYQEFSARGMTPTLHINGDETIHGLLEGIRYRIFDWILEENSADDILSEADVVVVDSYLAPAAFYARVAAGKGVPVFIDDNNRLPYPAGIVVNGSAGAEKLPYPANKNLTYLVGHKYILFREAFKNSPERNVAKPLETILVTFGGDDIRGLTSKIVVMLRRHSPPVSLKVIVGPGFHDKQKLLKMADGKTEMIVDPSVERIVDVMSRSDAAVSAGGQTLYEMASMGLPAIVVAVADNQMNNVNGLVDAGAIEYAGWWETPNLMENILRAFHKFEDASVRESLSHRARELVDGKGGHRIVSVILEKTKRENTVLKQ